MVLTLDSRKKIFKTLYMPGLTHLCKRINNEWEKIRAITEQKNTWR